MIVMIDHYDSFTYNLYQYIGEICEDIKVFRYDEVTLEDLKKMDISHMIFSPGPGHPKDMKRSMEYIKYFKGKIPILGVCLGHQMIAQVLGAKVVHAKSIVHGKTSNINHNGKGLFKNIKNPMKVTRYHSLAIQNMSIYHPIKVTATSEDGEIMAITHEDESIYGVQFHPESIATDEGKKILKNFLEM